MDALNVYVTQDVAIKLPHEVHVVHFLLVHDCHTGATSLPVSSHEASL